MTVTHTETSVQLQLRTADHSDEAFQQGKNLPFINPSSLETLRALVQEIQSSGETDSEIWKDCEIEAALSRMPVAGSRVSLQTRLDEVGSEDRPERLNRELGRRWNELPNCSRSTESHSVCKTR